MTVAPLDPTSLILATVTLDLSATNCTVAQIAQCLARQLLRCTPLVTDPREVSVLRASVDGIWVNVTFLLLNVATMSPNGTATKALIAANLDCGAEGLSPILSAAISGSDDIQEEKPSNVAGIILGILVFCCALGGIFFLLFKRKKKVNRSNALFVEMLEMEHGKKGDDLLCRFRPIPKPIPDALEEKEPFDEPTSYEPPQQQAPSQEPSVPDQQHREEDEDLTALAAPVCSDERKSPIDAGTL